MPPKPWENLEHFNHDAAPGAEPQRGEPQGGGPPVRTMDQRLAELERLDPAERCRRLEARLRRIEAALGDYKRPPATTAQLAELIAFEQTALQRGALIAQEQHAAKQQTAERRTAERRTVERRRFNSPVQIAECGGPCAEGGPDACDCGALVEPEQRPAPAADRPLWREVRGATQAVPGELDWVAAQLAVADWLAAREHCGAASALRIEACRAREAQ